MLAPTRASVGGADQGGDENRQHHHQRQRPGQRCEQRPRDHEQGDDHREHERAAGEDRGAPGGAPGRPGGVDGAGAGGQLLAEARDHQQRVVDAEGQAHHRADGERHRVDAEPVGEDREQPARAEDRDRAEAEWDQRRDRRAKDEQEDDQQDRHRDQLSALEGVDRFVLNLLRSGGKARLGGADRCVDLRFENAFKARNRLIDRLVDTNVEVGKDECAARAGTQLPDRARVPGRERRDPWVMAQGADQRRALPVDRRGRAPEKDREERGRAEVLTQHPVGARGRGAGDLDRTGAQPLVEPGAEDDQDEDEQRSDRQRAPRVAQHRRGAGLVPAPKARIVVSPFAPNPHRPPNVLREVLAHLRISPHTTDAQHSGERRAANGLKKLGLSPCRRPTDSKVAGQPGLGRISA